MKQLKLIGLFIILISLFYSGKEVKEAKKMNVLFIISDDLCTNSMKEAATPNIDKLAKMGMSFSSAYCQYPVCVPSRNSFLSGLRPDQIGSGWEPLRKLMPDVTTLPQLFRENGFYTASIAKIFHVSQWDSRWPSENWKFDDPKAWDFRINCPPANQGENQIPPFPRKGLRFDFPGYGGPIDYGMMSFESDLAQEDGQATQEAIRQLDLNLDKPFFMGVGYRRPHAPFIAPEKYFAPYPLNTIELPDPGDRSDVTDFAFSIHPPNYGDPAAIKPNKMCYLASVSYLDAEVGRLLQSLEEHHMMENTIIIFISDHGFQLGEHGEWHKNSLFEESAQVPMIIRIPGVTQPGSSTNELVELIDLYPTLQDYFDLPDPPHQLPGRSLIPLLENPSTDFEKRPAITRVRRKTDDNKRVMGYSIRWEKYRYNEWWMLSEPQELLATELYDLEKDPVSENNLNNNDAYTRIVKSLSKKLEAYRLQSE